MTLSPLIRRSGIAMVVFGTAVVAHFVLQKHFPSSPSASTPAVYLVSALLIGMGWIGLGELRALEKHSLIRTLQVITVVLAVPALVVPTARNAFTACAAAVVVFAALPLALWHRRERRLRRR